MEEFKINNNVAFEDEETKAEYQKYLDEINEYNKKIANGEKTEKDLSAITEEFKLKFNINSRTNNTVNDKDEFEELTKKIDNSLNISEASNLDEKLSQINNRIAELNIEEEDSALKLIAYIITKKIDELEAGSKFSFSSLLVDENGKDYCYLEIEKQNRVRKIVDYLCENNGIFIEIDPDGERFANAFFVDYIKYNKN